MANQEHLDILKQGVGVWNRWRKEHPKIEPDLGGANLSQSYLEQVHLKFANLYGVDLSYANLMYADLTHADLTRANLSYANLTSAIISGADLIRADLRGTTLSRAALFGTRLTEAILSEVSIAGTFFGDIDLSVVKGLETVRHLGPSALGIDTIIRSQGNIPEAFLRNVGVPGPIIDMIPSLVGSLKPIDFYSCFISYSSKDQDFAERLHADLQAKGVRCWFAPEHMRTGDKIRYRVDESIRNYDKLVIVLSQYSVASLWVEHEVETALAKELEGKPNVIFPIRLDQAVMDSKEGWASHIRLTRHITDFTQWKDHDHYQKAFNRLLRDLKAKA